MIEIADYRTFFLGVLLTVLRHRNFLLQLQCYGSWNVYPGSKFSHPGSRVKKIPNQHRRILSILSLKTVSKLLRKMIWDVHPGFGFFSHPGSRIQKSNQHRIRILNTGSGSNSGSGSGSDSGSGSSSVLAQNLDYKNLPFLMLIEAALLPSSLSSVFVRTLMIPFYYGSGTGTLTY